MKMRQPFFSAAIFHSALFIVNDSYEPHRRFNPLTGDWILVSPHRLQRPWQGKEEVPTADKRPAYDSSCYLCPGNLRADGTVNPDYTGVHVFTNDFPALLPNEISQKKDRREPLLRAEGVRGICRVLCYSPNHNLTMARLSQVEIEGVIAAWSREYYDLSQINFINNIQIFENKGELMGCSNPHPHGQIWATNVIPNRIIVEQEHQRQYFLSGGEKQTLLADYLTLEECKNERIVFQNEGWVALVPYWAEWPYELMLIPRRPVATLLELSSSEAISFAHILKEITIRYDNLFQCSFPYTMGIHQAPISAADQPFWHLHVHFYPPLLRSATVKKFMVGYEMLGMPQRDLTAELAAQTLAALPAQHYLERTST